MDETIWIYTAENHGRSRAIYLRLADYRNRIIGGELATLWLSHCQVASVRYGTAQHSAMAVRKLLRFFDSRLDSSVASLSGAGDELGILFLEWQQSLLASNLSEKYFFLVISLLRRAAYDGLQLQPALLLLVSQPLNTGLRLRTDTPLDEFTNADRVALTRAATRDVDQAEARLARGATLWEDNSAFRALIAFAADQITYAPVLHAICSDPILATDIERASGTTIPTGRGGAQRATRMIGSLIAPTPLECMSYQILIQWATGVAPEQVRDLTTDGITFGSSGVEWVTMKHRARRMIHLSFDGVESWQVAGLFKRLLCSTAIVREISGSNRAFTTYTLGGQADRRALAIKPMPFPKPSLLTWLESRSVEVLPPFDLRRIRKSFTAVRAGITDSPELAAQPDHSLNTFVQHYASTTTTLTRAGRVIIRAQNQVVERAASHHARVIPTNAEAFSETAESDLAIHELAVTVADRDFDERSLTGSACVDPLDSPFSRKGEMCTKAPFACLVCPNAVIFNDHAPQLLLMQKALEDQRLLLAPDEYGAAIAPLLEALQSYLEQMDEWTLDAARKSIAAGEMLRLPFGSRVAL